MPRPEDEKELASKRQKEEEGMGWELAVQLLENAHTCWGCPQSASPGQLGCPMLIIYTGIRVASDP